MGTTRRPSSPDGIKRLAKAIKAELGLPHHAALNAAARQAGFQNFTHARHQLQHRQAASSPEHAASQPDPPRQLHPSEVYLEQCRQAWVKVIAELNPRQNPRIAWTGVSVIRGVLADVFAGARSHAHLPTGGGHDFAAARLSTEPGCLEFQVANGAAYVMRPKALVLEHLPEAPSESFLLLQLDALAPSGIYVDEDPGIGLRPRRRRREEVVEVAPREYIERAAWDEGRLGFDENGREVPLPAAARLVVRWFDGQVLFVTKGSLWNGSPATYDGRHDAMPPAAIRSVIERSLAALW